HRPELVALLDHVAANPLHVVRHLLASDPRRDRRRLLEVLRARPELPPQNHVGVHCCSFSLTGASGFMPCGAHPDPRTSTERCRPRWTNARKWLGARSFRRSEETLM